MVYQALHLFVNKKIMKQNIIVALVLNIVLLLIFSYIFISKEIYNDIFNWRFLSLLVSFVVFCIFIFLLLKQLKKT